MIYNNTVSKRSTNFLCGTQLIQEAGKTFNIASENWAYPYMRFGDPEDRFYYAEVWTNGMDWNKNYWLLEQGCYAIRTLPMIIFASHKKEEGIMDYDLNNFLRDIIEYRRYLATFEDGEEKYRKSGDSMWSFFDVVKSPEPALEGVHKMASDFFYASLKSACFDTDFNIYIDLVPAHVIGRTYDPPTKPSSGSFLMGKRTE